MSPAIEAGAPKSSPLMRLAIPLLSPRTGPWFPPAASVPHPKNLISHLPHEATEGKRPAPTLPQRLGIERPWEIFSTSRGLCSEDSMEIVISAIERMKWECVWKRLYKSECYINGVFLPERGIYSVFFLLTKGMWILCGHFEKYIWIKNK